MGEGEGEGGSEGEDARCPGSSVQSGVHTGVCVCVRERESARAVRLAGRLSKMSLLLLNSQEFREDR